MPDDTGPTIPKWRYDELAEKNRTLEATITELKKAAETGGTATAELKTVKEQLATTLAEKKELEKTHGRALEALTARLTEERDLAGLGLVEPDWDLIDQQYKKLPEQGRPTKKAWIEGMIAKPDDSPRWMRGSLPEPDATQTQQQTTTTDETTQQQTTTTKPTPTSRTIRQAPTTTAYTPEAVAAMSPEEFKKHESAIRAQLATPAAGA